MHAGPVGSRMDSQRHRGAFLVVEARGEEFFKERLVGRGIERRIARDRENARERKVELLARARILREGCRGGGEGEEDREQDGKGASAPHGCSFRIAKMAEIAHVSVAEPMV